MINLTFDERELIKNMCDLHVRNTGIVNIRPIISILDKIKQNEIDFSEEDKQLIRLVCDTAVRATGLSSIEQTIKLLNRLIGITPT